MGRPKRDEGQRTAQERLEETLWAMLAEMPYHEVTCKELRSRAGVSHTTFYYHFQCIDELAQWAFDRLAVPEVPAAIMNVMSGNGSIEDLADRVPDMALRISRMRLLATSGSPYLIALLREAIIHAWLASVGVADNDLTDEARADITFAFGGVMALFGSELANDPRALTAFSQRDIGQGVMRTIRRLAAGAAN